MLFKRGTFQAWLNRPGDYESQKEKETDGAPDFGLDGDETDDDEFDFEFNVSRAGVDEQGADEDSYHEPVKPKAPSRLNRFRSGWKKKDTKKGTDKKKRTVKRRIKARKVK
jgi:hypothetical protein